MSGHFGTRTVRHQDTSAPNNWCRSVRTLRQQFFVGAELSHGHFGLLPNCLKTKGNGPFKKHDGTDGTANKGNICFPSILSGENLYAVTVQSVIVTKYVNIYYEKLINILILLLHLLEDR